MHTKTFLMWGFHIVSYFSLFPLLLKARISEEHHYQDFKNFACDEQTVVLTIMLVASQ